MYQIRFRCLVVDSISLVSIHLFYPYIYIYIYIKINTCIYIYIYPMIFISSPPRHVLPEWPHGRSLGRLVPLHRFAAPRTEPRAGSHRGHRRTLRGRLLGPGRHHQREEQGGPFWLAVVNSG